MKLAFTLVVATLAAGCAQQVWNKPGATQDDFSRDRYACIQESQQRVSGAQVNQFGGAARSQMQTNDGIYGACMNARGWYLGQASASSSSSQPRVSQSAQPSNVRSSSDKLKDAQARHVSWSSEKCASPDYALIYKKTPCNAKQVDSSYLSLTDRASPEEVKQIQRLVIVREDHYKVVANELYLYGGARGSAMSKLFVENGSEVNEAFERLASGSLNWGGFNQRRVDIQNSTQERMKKILATNY